MKKNSLTNVKRFAKNWFIRHLYKRREKAETAKHSRICMCSVLPDHFRLSALNTFSSWFLHALILLFEFFSSAVFIFMLETEIKIPFNHEVTRIRKKKWEIKIHERKKNVEHVNMEHKTINYLFAFEYFFGWKKKKVKVPVRVSWFEGSFCGWKCWITFKFIFVFFSLCLVRGLNSIVIPIFLYFVVLQYCRTMRDQILESFNHRDFSLMVVGNKYDLVTDSNRQSQVCKQEKFFFLFKCLIISNYTSIDRFWRCHAHYFVVYLKTFFQEKIKTRAVVVCLCECVWACWQIKYYLFFPIRKWSV